MIQNDPSTLSISRCNSIEILSVDLLDQNRDLANKLRKLAHRLELEFGWHYLLDIIWIIRHLDILDGKIILDAGAGVGIMQWYLAAQGASVISVDRVSRSALPLRFRSRYPIHGLRDEDLLPTKKVLFKYSQNTDGTSVTPRSTVKHYISSAKQLVKVPINLTSIFFQGLSNSKHTGSVYIYNQDLTRLDDIEDSSLDGVVAVSSLEHNQPNVLEAVIAEIQRVLKPGGMLLATLGAARDRDWWHEPSRGWCYTEETLKRIFQLPESTSTNYSQYDILLDRLAHCVELKNNLAKFYFKSGSNGMPWGKWDPKYQPVGVCKLKNG